MHVDLKKDPKSPPPLPTPSPRTGGGTLAHLRAFLAIRRLRLVELSRRLLQRARRRPVVAGLGAAAVVLGVVLGAAFALDLVPEVDVNLLAPKSVKEARADARAHPDSAGAQRELGHALWTSRKRHAAVKAYARALAADAAAADDAMVTHLVAAFGGRDQPEAEALIWKHQLVSAEEGLKALTRSKRPTVRWGAVHTLDRLGKGTKGYWETAYILDLDSPSCDVRRAAVDKLGAIGTRRAAAALREAKADDEKTGGWFHSRCLGERVGDAEQKILARR